MIERLERLLNLVIALRETPQPLTASDVRERVAGYGQADPEAFRRMFERDKADLRALGVPVTTAPVSRWDDRIGYRIEPSAYDLPAVRLEPDELTALALALSATGLLDEAALGLRKLEVDAGDPDAERRDTRPFVEVDVAAPHHREVMEAQLSRTPLRFRYRPAGREEQERVVDPYALVHRRGRWYLVGRDHDRDARRAFRLDRIVEGVRPAGPPGAFDPPAADVGVDDVVPPHPGGSSAEVMAAPAVAWQVARRAGGAGRPVDGDPQRAGWTTFSVPMPDLDRFVAWALEHGPDLEVVGPPAARARIVELLETWT